MISRLLQLHGYFGSIVPNESGACRKDQHFGLFYNIDSKKGLKRRIKWISVKSTQDSKVVSQNFHIQKQKVNKKSLELSR